MRSSVLQERSLEKARQESRGEKGQKRTDLLIGTREKQRKRERIYMANLYLFILILIICVHTFILQFTVA